MLLVHLDSWELKPRASSKSFSARAFADFRKTALNRANVGFERRLMSDTNDKAFQELQCENGKLTLANLKKGLYFLIY